ncbi:MAG TPA: hypothetical protein VGX92_15425 [Pyrinomonadaceae bacterium]|jgi:hypothetical protein|nr:hypothetical protein [Pyrinomonadaceae bacterium]
MFHLYASPSLQIVAAGPREGRDPFAFGLDEKLASDYNAALLEKH